MSQHDFNIADATGDVVRADLNAALAALAGLSSGAWAPTPSYPYQLWFDTANDSVKLRNGANNAWIAVGTIDPVANTWSLAAGGAIDAIPIGATTPAAGTFTTLEAATLTEGGSPVWTDANQVRLGGAGGLVTDWNTATENGWYRGSGAANSPSGLINTAGQTIQFGPNDITQVIYGAGATSANNTSLYRREMHAGVWAPWYKLRWSEAELDARYGGAQVYRSPVAACPANTSKIVFAHGLGAEPDDVNFFLIFKNAVGTFNVGDTLKVSQTFDCNSWGQSVWKDATNITYVLGGGGPSIIDITGTNLNVSHADLNIMGVAVKWM